MATTTARVPAASLSGGALQGQGEGRGRCTEDDDEAGGPRGCRDEDRGHHGRRPGGVAVRQHFAAARRGAGRARPRTTTRAAAREGPGARAAATTAAHAPGASLSDGISQRQGEGRGGCARGRRRGKPPVKDLGPGPRPPRLSATGIVAVWRNFAGARRRTRWAHFRSVKVRASGVRA